MALKVGVVGMGGIGNSHANCHSNDELAELVAVCDVVKDKADSGYSLWLGKSEILCKMDERRQSRSNS